MGNTESKKVMESQEITEIQRVADQGGPNAIRKYMLDNLDKWKTEKVKLAVTGATTTGKSSFINKLHGTKHGDTKFAAQGTGDTTTKPTCYTNNRHRHIEFYDLPGIGTELFPQETYIEITELHRYDFIFIFFASVIQEVDVWLANKLTKMKKPFCFVRSKVDVDFDNAKVDGRDPKNVIEEARKNVLASFERMKILKESKKLFIISCKKPQLGEMENLVSYLEKELSAGKVAAIMFALPLLTEEIIEKKFNQLSKRMRNVAFFCSTFSLEPNPCLEKGINISIITSEIQHYIDAFGLSRDCIEQLKGFDCSKLKASCFSEEFANRRTQTFTGIKKVAFNVSSFVYESVFPLLSSVKSEWAGYTYLKGVLDDIREDAKVVYQHMQKQEKRSLLYNRY